MADNRMCCKYWDKCFQKNPDHFKRYRHPLKFGQKTENDLRSKNKFKRKAIDDPAQESELSNAKKPNLSIDSEDKPEEKNDTVKSPEKIENIENVELTESIENEHTESTENTTDSTNNVNTGETTSAENTTNVTSTKSNADSNSTESVAVLEITDNTADLKTIESIGNAADLNITENITTDPQITDDKTNLESTEPQSTEIITESQNTEIITDDQSTEIITEVQSTESIANLQDTEATADFQSTKNLEPKQSDVNNDHSNENSIQFEKTDNSNEIEEKPQNSSNFIKIKNDTVIKASVQALEAEDTEDIYTEAKELISKTFLMPMPDDFYKFFSLCKELKPSDPANAFKIADLRLVGAYDVLLGNINKKTKITDNFLTHWRYFYDPPEFQTVIKGNDKEGLHFGYWRDRPSTSPVFVASNCLNISHKIKPVAENIFGAVGSYLEERAKKASAFEKPNFFNLFSKVKAFADKHNITLETQTDKMKSREKYVVARTIHGAGIVCPFNKKTKVGYRPLSASENDLLKIIKKINDARSDQQRRRCMNELDEILRHATNAAEECDFGTCLELGHDLLSTGCLYVHDTILTALNIAYSQLERNAFLKIIEAHMANRKKGTYRINAIPPK